MSNYSQSSDIFDETLQRDGVDADWAQWIAADDDQVLYTSNLHTLKREQNWSTEDSSLDRNENLCFNFGSRHSSGNKELLARSISCDNRAAELSHTSRSMTLTLKKQTRSTSSVLLPRTEALLQAIAESRTISQDSTEKKSRSAPSRPEDKIKRGNSYRAVSFGSLLQRLGKWK